MAQPGNQSAQPSSSTQHSAFRDLPEYRAPTGNGHALVQPSLAKVLRSRLGFKRLPAQSPLFDSQLERVHLGGVSLSQLRSLARRAAWQTAVDYTASYRPLWFDTQDPANQEHALNGLWLVAGHQPELFHPGVWFKNFLLSQAGSEAGAVALNLVIDNDLCRSPAVRVLCQSSESAQQLRTESVLFDAPAPAVAWESRCILDYELLQSFPHRVRQAMLVDLPAPLLEQLWPQVMAAGQRTGNLGLALAQGRHALEGELGLKTLELPLSQLVGQESFGRFSLALLGDIQRFQEVYNRQRALYRSANHIRSHSHPVPELTTRYGWYEAPWWVYRHSEPTRRRLFVRRDGIDLLLSDGAGWQTTIEGPLQSADALSDWQQCAVDGVKLRPRALITTLYSRLVISDLFLHGIGGGKYDQLTDAIITDYFGIVPPTMIVATATMHLPLGKRGPEDTILDNRLATQAAQATAWQLRYHPEKHLPVHELDDQEVNRLLHEKQELLGNIPPRGQKWSWHRQITRINQRLAELNEQAAAGAQVQMQQLTNRARQLKLAYSREFSFCLFPQNYLVDALQRLAAAEFEHSAAK